ncbi:MAG: ABC transporter ATP-binding protein [Rothia sp. (in: high G+C Gram-positive bacteria)]|nr:ABC transporter ATP-binding protein [Rothia sp. (in: high G+C Gram-positive bacteria)]
MTTAQTVPASPTSGVSDAALVISNLVKEFKPPRTFAQENLQLITERGTYRAVNNLSLDIQRGQVTVLLGANGAGKTTTLACAQGLLKPDGGSIELLGQTPWGAGPQLRSRVGIMLQDGGLPQYMRPVPLLRHIARMYENPVELEPLVKRLGIDTFNGTTVRRLSGGQKQRVALAAAMLGRPEILFLDEPTAGLDPQSRAVVFEIIAELRDAGVAIVLTTHLLDDAQRIADRVFMIERGTVVLSGSMSEVLAAGSQKRQVLTFTAERGLTLSTFFTQQQAEGLALLEKSPGRYELSGSLTPDHLVALTTYWQRTGVIPSEFSLAPRTLEDVFLELSGKKIR